MALFFLAVLRFDSKIFFFLPSCQARTCIKDLLELKDLHVAPEVYIYLFKKFTAEIKSKIAASEKHTSHKQHHDHRDRTNPSNVLEKKQHSKSIINAYLKKVMYRKANTHLYKPMKHCFIFKETPTTNITNSTGPIWLLVRHGFKFSLLLCLKYPQVDLSKP